MAKKTAGKSAKKPLTTGQKKARTLKKTLKSRGKLQSPNLRGQPKSGRFSKTNFSFSTTTTKGGKIRKVGSNVHGPAFPVGFKKVKITAGKDGG